MPNKLEIFVVLAFEATHFICFFHFYRLLLPVMPLCPHTIYSKPFHTFYMIIVSSLSFQYPSKDNVDSPPYLRSQFIMCINTSICSSNAKKAPSVSLIMEKMRGFSFQFIQNIRLYQMKPNFQSLPFLF